LSSSKVWGTAKSGTGALKNELSAWAADFDKKLSSCDDLEMLSRFCEEAEKLSASEEAPALARVLD
jgi:hypothetical protein